MTPKLDQKIKEIRKLLDKAIRRSEKLREALVFALVARELSSQRTYEQARIIALKTIEEEDNS